MKIFRQGLNILSDSFKGIFRNFGMSLASTISITAMLTLFGFVFLIILNINLSVNHLGEEIDKVVIYLKDDITQGNLDDLISKVGSDDRVKEVKYTSKEEALEELKQSFGDKAHLLDLVKENNTLPASLVVSLKDLSYSKEVSKIIEGSPGIERVDYHYELVNKMMTFEKGVKYIGIGVVLVLLLVSILIIHNTIKIAVANRKREINIMKYIGATNSYIRGPFVIEGIIFGIVGALIAFLLVYNVYDYYYVRMNPQIQSLLGMDIVRPINIKYDIGLIFLCIGIGIGYLGSLLSTKKFLNV
ncbi:MAG: permease-like cell division protein FtsX [Peptoniphilaceae bacterium]